MAKKKDIRRVQPKKKGGFHFSLFHKIVPILIIIISMIVATQNCAKDLNYDPKIMGEPWFVFKGEPFYFPWGIILAYFVSASKGIFSVGDIVYTNFKIVAYGVLISVAVYLILVYIRKITNRDDKNLMANGKWGDEKGLKRAGLIGGEECGVVIGQTLSAQIETDISKGSVKLDVKKTGELVCYHTNVCGMLMAGTRLGKGVSTVIPTHLSFPDSLISVDPKGENYDITAGYRYLFSKLYKFCPTSKESLRFNILNEIDPDNAFRDANTIATILTSPDNPNSSADPHWSETAKQLITAAILHVLCGEDIKVPKSLGGVYQYLASGNADSKDDKGDAKKELLKKMLNSRHCTKEIHQSIVNYASSILSAADEEMGSIFSSALESLNVFNDPKVAYVTDDSDFCLNDFKYGKYPISWYLTIPFPDLDRLKKLLKLIIEFVCRKFSQGLTSFGNEPLAHRILFLIDEFPTLGKMETIQTFAGILNGYGISFLWICQSKAQIDMLYGQNAPILEHCRYMWTYAMSDDNVAEYFSKRIGTEGIIKQNTSNSGNRFEMGMNSVSVSNDITERRLFTANEIETMDPEYLLLFTQGGDTQLLKKIAYYSDERFMHKINLPKPEKRKQLLKECKNSFVITNDDPNAWWKNFDNANEIEYKPTSEDFITDGQEYYETEPDESEINDNLNLTEQGLFF